MASERAWTTGHKAAADLLKLSSVPFLIGGVACLIVDESNIAWLGAPVVILSVFMIFVASDIARKAVRVQE